MNLPLGLKKARLIVRSKKGGALECVVMSEYSLSVHTQRR